MRSNTIPTAPWTIPAGPSREDIAAIIYKDGRRVDFNTTECYAESSTSPQSLPPASSISPQRTRDRKASITSNLSSNSSIREAFTSLNVQGDRLGSSLPGIDLSQPRQRASFNSLDSTQQFFESPTKLTGNATDGDITDFVPELQDQMVAEANGADTEDVFPIEDYLNLNQTNDLSDPQIGYCDGLNQLQSCTQVPVSSISQSWPQESLFLGWGGPHIHKAPSPINANSGGQIPSNKPIALKANGQPKATPGRKKGYHFTSEKKAKTAFQRILGNCEYCRGGKRPCDAGTPCKHCERHNIPCIRPVLQCLVNNMLSVQMRWHAYPRTPSNFFPGGYRVINGSATIPFTFAFGPSLYAEVQGLNLFQDSDCRHKHVWYSKHSSLLAKPSTSDDIMLPLLLLHPEQVHAQIDSHLDNLVNHHLSEFKLYQSRFAIFDSIVGLFNFYRTENEEYADLLRIALKLLVLVHAGDTYVDKNNPQIVHILQNLVPAYNGTQKVTPCLIRAQLGRYSPTLARSLLKTVLEKLVQICANRRYDQHPISLAVFAVVLMTLESIMYHGARWSFHHYLGDEHASIDESCNTSLSNGEKSATEILKFYRDGFEDCHRLMAHVGEDPSLSRSVPDQFILNMNRAIQNASTYLQEKGETHVESLQDVSQLFDRLLARLFLMH